MTEQALAASLAAARHGGGRPVAARLSDEAEAYRVQAATMALLGPIGGWKVGAAAPDGPISCAPLPADTLFASPHEFGFEEYTQREIESEICFKLGADLPARARPYAAAELMAAIESCHPGIEVLQCRYAVPEAASSIDILADLIQSGGYVVGEAIDGWRSIDFGRLRVRQAATGGPPREAKGNPAGCMVRLLLWLANHGAHWAGGLRRGQIVTCGSWTGKLAVPAGGEAVTRYDGAVPVVVRFREATSASA